MAREAPTVVQVLREYAEGRVLKLSDDSIVAEGLCTEGPIPGRVRFVSPPDPPRGEDPNNVGLRSRRKLVYRERKPWQKPPPKPVNPGSLRLAAEHRARARAFDALGRDAEPGPPVVEDPPASPTIEEAVLHEAAENARVVMAKWNQGV